MDHESVNSMVRYLQLGQNYDEWKCSKSSGKYLQFTQLSSTAKKIPKDISTRIEEVVQSATLGIISRGSNIK